MPMARVTFKQKYPDYSTVNTTFTYHVHTVWMFSFMSEVIKHKLSAKEIEKAINDQLHATLGYDFFHADRGSFTVYDNNSELFLKLKYSF